MGKYLYSIGRGDPKVPIASAIGTAHPWPTTGTARLSMLTQVYHVPKSIFGRPIKLAGSIAKVFLAFDITRPYPNLFAAFRVVTGHADTGTLHVVFTGV